MVNSLYSFNYFPLVSGSEGHDSLDSSYSCSIYSSAWQIRYIRYIRVQKTPHPHGKIRVHLCPSVCQKYSSVHPCAKT